jgi:hypothetical protein
VGVTIPPGNHVLRVWFGQTPIRVAAIGVSGVALAVLLVVLARGVGPLRLLLGVGVLVIVVVAPRLLHNWLDPEGRPAAQVVNADVSPAARVAALELAERPARPGETVPVTLIWQALEYTPRDLQSGLRLVPLDGGSRVLSERWGRPNRERTPTGKWLVGELIPDTLLLRIPNDLPAGRYRLQAGLRDPDANDRAPLGLADVGEIEVR